MIQPLDYNTELTLEEAKKRFREVVEAFEEVKKKYSGFLGKLRRNIASEDNKTLSDCIGVLLPLGMNDAVQQELQTGKVNPLWTQIGNLQQEILLFAAKFKNSGISVIPGADDFPGFL